MKSLLSTTLTLCALQTISAINLPFRPVAHKPQIPVMSEPQDMLKVPGDNNATYGPVPKAEQLLQVEHLSIAPSPIPVNKIFFTLLRGEILPSKRENLPNLAHLLATATLTITSSAVLADGTHLAPQSYTVPFRTTAFADSAHISIRNRTGSYVEHFDGTGTNDILSDYWIPGMWLQTGMWTFEVVVKLGDGKCLFAISLTQWLEKKNL
ncbi:hypothetical protein BDW02DRAFT_566801 [Decorospora gaudefroyi]|uniref:Ubiquitin 3 binding protein But2 C-terminal domain-containing protein n=1 Tax=Decorospora gaudefroyi TaxID=184978 RepID=A0A6A5KMA5_9PLEO|nr:hypothetical protein BDW02DRAFT_566801 [Decorospora gaudefroyi]